jgi:hypothetical protein
MAGYIQTESFKVDIQGNRVLSESDFALIVTPEEGMVVIVDTAGGNTRVTAKEMRLYSEGIWKVVGVPINGIMTISAEEGIAAGIILESDQADDAGDSWKISGAPPTTDGTATATVSGGAVNTVTRTAAGAGYISAPTVVVTPHASDTITTTAVITATITGGSIDSLTISNPGVGYNNPPTLEFIGGDKIGKLVISNDQNVKGTFVEHFSLTANAAVIDSKANFAGDVIVAGDLTVSGATTTVSTTNLLVSDKIITLNDGGIAGSGGGTGIEVEENNIQTGYIKTNADGDWTFKAPVANGVASTGSILTIDINATKTLTVAGNLNIESDSNINQDVTTDASPTFTGIMAAAAFTVDAAGDIELNAGGGDFQFKKDTAEYMRILDGGNVGIGEATPTYKLDIATGASASALRIKGSTTGQDVNCAIENTGTASGDDTLLSLTAAAGAGNPTLRFAIAGNETWTMGIDNADGDKFKIGNGTNLSASRITIQGSNIGIGVDDPDEKLEVAGRIHISTEVAAPSAPAAADGGVLYTKADGKLYWISDDLSETDLTLNTVGSTNLSATVTGYSFIVESSSGNNVALPLADTNNWGVMSDEMFNKLDSIWTGAEVNVQSDWNSGSGDSQILNKPSLVTAFTGLTDTPSNFTGAANKFAKVNSSGNAIEFENIAIPASPMFAAKALSGNTTIHAELNSGNGGTLMLSDSSQSSGGTSTGNGFMVNTALLTHTGAKAKYEIMSALASKGLRFKADTTAIDSFAGQAQIAAGTGNSDGISISDSQKLVILYTGSAWKYMVQSI